MKRYLGIVSVIVLAVALVGCGKKDEAETTPAAEPDSETMNKAMEGVSDTVTKTVDEATEKVQEMKAQADETVADAKTKLAEATSQFDSIVAGIKENLAANSFDKALAGLKEGLALPNLTGEQKGILQQLQEAIQQAMAKKATGDAAKQAEGAVDGATKKVDGLLKGFGK
jgi:uncharacterized lipoprotein YehR (DUF1307 family)